MNNLQVVEYSNQRVLTTQQLAEIYETDVKNIQMNFKRNENRFIEKRDYYLLKGNDLQEFKNLPTVSRLVDKRTPSLILWTERGANRHSKILDTDKAWQQFDVLEETYFKVKNNQLPQLNNTNNQLVQNNQMIMAMLDMVQSVSNNINANTKVLLSLAESMNRKHYNNRNARNNEQKQSNKYHEQKEIVKEVSYEKDNSLNTIQSKKNVLYDEEKFRKVASEKLRELYKYTNMNFNALLKDVYEIMRDKYRINLNRLKFDYMKENNVDTLSMFAFVSKCDNDEIREVFMFIIDDMLNNKRRIYEMSLKSNEEEIDFSSLFDEEDTDKNKEHTTKTHFINYDKFNHLSQLIHDKSPYKTCTFRIVYKRMNDFKDIKWDVLLDEYKKQHYFKDSRTVTKIDVVRENEDLTELFNKSVEDLLKEKESHLI